MNGDILRKADALIRRRRAELGGGDEPLPQHWPDDIPVLTEVVAEGAPPGTAPQAIDRENLRAEIARELDVWLDENLPQVVVHLLDGIADTLIRHVHESAREDLLPRLEQTLRNGSRDEEA